MGGSIRPPPKRVGISMEEACKKNIHLKPTKNISEAILELMVQSNFSIVTENDIFVLFGGFWGSKGFKVFRTLKKYSQCLKLLTVPCRVKAYGADPSVKTFEKKNVFY